MSQGDKSKYTDKQVRKAEHIAASYETRGVPEDEAKARAWATVNKDDGGGNKPGGSGHGKTTDKKTTDRPAAHKGGRAGGAVSAGRTAEARSASAKKAAATRKRNASKASG